MSIERAIEKYIETIESDVFASYEKKFAHAITSALSECYHQKLDETDMVKDVERIVNSCRNLNDKSSKPYFELSTNAVYIHGYPNKSGVEFDYYGKNAPVELGDIIFIISIVFNGQKYFEKFTITQFKKDKKRTRSISWNIDKKEQLYLLSRFPTFRGVKGSLVPQKDFNLSNYSGCLGSYGFLYRPGDFTFVSATRLNSYLGDNKKINGNDLFRLCQNRDVIDTNQWFHFWHEWIHMIDIYRHFCKPHCDLCSLFLPQIFLGNCHFSRNAFDFVDKYLRLCMGEPTVMKIGRRNVGVRNFLYELLSAIKIKAKRENRQDILNFIDAFFRYGFSDDEGEGGFREGNVFDFDGGGIGVVHTVINLGE